MNRRWFWEHTPKGTVWCAVCFALAMVMVMVAFVGAPAWADAGDEVLGRQPAELGIADEELPVLDATFAAVVDDEGQVWFGRGAREPAQIASLTKIMTAAVAVEHLAADDMITVTATAASVGESSAGLVAGDVMRFNDALKALLCASGNDAATALAEAAGARILAGAGLPGADDASACYSAFVEAMNAKGAEWGLTATSFTNPHGLDFDRWTEGQYSCALDVAETLRRAMQNDLVRASIGFSQTNIEVMRGGVTTVVALTNTDELLHTYEGTCAAKTGFTQAAGPCSASAVARGDGHEYYAVVLASSSKPQRFVDAAALYDWVYAHREGVLATIEKQQAEAAQAQAEAEAAAKAAEMARFQLVATERSIEATIGGVTKTFPQVAEVTHLDWPRRVVIATVAEPAMTIELATEGPRIEQEVTFSELRGDVHTGDVVGKLVFTRGGETVWETDLLAAEDVAAPTWWEAIGVAFERFVGGLTGKPDVTESRLLTLGTMRMP